MFQFLCETKDFASSLKRFCEMLNLMNRINEVKSMSYKYYKED